MSLSVYNNLTQSEPPAQNGAPLSGISELKSLSRWVTWRLEERNGKLTKVPYNPWTGNKAASNRPQSWSPHLLAQSAARKHGHDGIGFMFSMDDDLVAIDLDNCRDPETRIVEDWAMAMVKEFGTYAEPSAGTGSGLHIIGRGKKIHDRCRNWKHDHGTDIEIYEKTRLMTMSLDPLPGFETIRNIQQPLDRFITEHWIQHLKEPTPQPLASTEGVSLASEEIIELARSHNPKFSDLYDRGDLSHYGDGHSEGDAALCAILAWYTKSPDQILEIWQSSALYRDKTNRRDYADRTITAALELVTGQYDPNYGKHTTISITVPTADDPEIAALDRDELLAIIRKQTAMIEAERAARIAAEHRAARAERIRTDLHRILRNKDLNAGARLTAFAIAMDMNARTADGESPADVQAFDKSSKKPYPVQAFKAPSVRYADATGHSPQTVQRHMRDLEKKGVLSKHLVRVETNVDDVDEETGEIVTVPGKRDVNYIALPDNDVINLVERIATYQRPEGDETGKHGGKREPRPACEQHPDAGTFTVKHEHIECAECHTVLQASEPKPTYHPPADDAESSHINLIADTPTVSNVYSDTKLIAEESDDGDTSNIKMVSDAPLMPTCDYHIGEGETCGDPTEEWEMDGYGSNHSNHLCHRHAEQWRNGGRWSA